MRSRLIKTGSDLLWYRLPDRAFPDRLEIGHRIVHHAMCECAHFLPVLGVESFVMVCRIHFGCLYYLQVSGTKPLIKISRHSTRRETLLTGHWLLITGGLLPVQLAMHYAQRPNLFCGVIRRPHQWVRLHPFETDLFSIFA